jgi:hypothetical protein
VCNEMERMWNDAVVGVVIGLWAEDPRNCSSIPGGVCGRILSPAISNTDSGTHPTSYSVGSEAFSKGVKLPKREAHHSSLLVSR